MIERENGVKYLAYLQSFSNTYAEVDTLRKIYDNALSAEVVGLIVSTRADCIDVPRADLLAEYAKKTFLMVELGLQSIFESTLEKMNRHCSFAQFLQGFGLLKERGVNVCVHIINGFEGESREMMIETVRKVSELQPFGIKIHMLNILENTELAEQYKLKPYKMLEANEYVDLVCDQLEILDEKIVVERLTGDFSKEKIVAPKWKEEKIEILNAIRQEFVWRKTKQGAKCVRGERND